MDLSRIGSEQTFGAVWSQIEVHSGVYVVEMKEELYVGRMMGRAVPEKVLGWKGIAWRGFEAGKGSVLLYVIQT